MGTGGWGRCTGHGVMFMGTKFQTGGMSSGNLHGVVIIIHTNMLHNSK